MEFLNKDINGEVEGKEWLALVEPTPLGGWEL
jgi:hypothetical protein